MPRKKGSKNKKVIRQSFVDPKAENYNGDISQPEVEILEEKVSAGTYKITLKSMGRVFISEGETFDEAINKIKISGGAKSTSVIKMEKDGKEITKILNARFTNGLFGQGSPTMKSIHLKSVRAILGV